MRSKLAAKHRELFPQRHQFIPSDELLILAAVIQDEIDLIHRKLAKARKWQHDHEHRDRDE